MLPLLLACATEKPVFEGESVGSCTYVSSFSGGTECRDYFEADLAEAEADCTRLGSTLVADSSCALEDPLGACWYEDSDGLKIKATAVGDSADCGSNEFGCETFASGYWEPAAACDGHDELVVLDDPFPQPELVCVDPVDGEGPGQSEGGKVCTWEIVSGATEEGRHFSDYADCDVPIRQRGYSAAPADARAAEEDPRMEDSAYVTELDWVRGQLNAASCECCHSAISPGGVGAVFDTDFDGNMANQFSDRGLAMGAGWIPTVGFGTYEPEQNNGFSRNSMENPDWSAFPTTDQARMIAFFEGELDHRGLSPADFEGDVYGAGPLDAQLYHEPERCSAEEGVDEDGLIRWLPGRARYVYVLEAGSYSPTVPPNLDTPEGTLWRIDLPAEGSPVSSETIRYGEVPAGMTQVFPASGAPAALVDGQDYYLYVSADVLMPISRCIFTAGEPAPADCGCDSGGASLGAGLALAGMLGLRRRRRPPGPGRVQGVRATTW